MKELLASSLAAEAKLLYVPDVPKGQNASRFCAFWGKLMQIRHRQDTIGCKLHACSWRWLKTYSQRLNDLMSAMPVL